MLRCHRQLIPALVLTIVRGRSCFGLLYPLVVTGASARSLFPYQANGSFIKRNGKVVGSTLIGQNFLDKQGQPAARSTSSPARRRPAPGTTPTASGGTNLGPATRAWSASSPASTPST